MAAQRGLGPGRGSELELLRRAEAPKAAARSTDHPIPGEGSHRCSLTLVAWLSLKGLLRVGDPTAGPAPGEGRRAASSHSWERTAGGHRRGNRTPLCPKAQWTSAPSTLGASLGGPPPPINSSQAGPRLARFSPGGDGSPCYPPVQPKSGLNSSHICSISYHGCYQLLACVSPIGLAAAGISQLSGEQSGPCQVTKGWSAAPAGRPWGQDLREDRGEDHTPRNLHYPSGSTRGSQTTDTHCLFSGERGGEINVES